MAVAGSARGRTSELRPATRSRDKKFDAVHLEAGAARLDDVGDDIYGWDCECTRWCRWPHGTRALAAPDGTVDSASEHAECVNLAPK
jgi:hypothetical protein